ncbi:MAG TPA: cysteine synthase A [Thermoanaerobaculia bacterium]|nr:cysteine synthase A [Thermoanaerobaculia bacterium]
MFPPHTPEPVDDILDLIGHTPLLHLRRILTPGVADIFGKLELLNPGGSVKDRIGIGMIRLAERDGLVQPGGTIIEPTAGNTGIALALAGVRLGYRVILCVPETFSVEKQEVMRALGGEVILTPGDDGIAGAIREAESLGRSIPDSWVAQQFRNPYNSQTHYETTGPEIFEQMAGRIDAFVAGSGSGGTFTGVSRFLKEKDPAIYTVLVEPQGSVLQGGQAGPHEVEGIGSSFIPDVLDLSLADEMITIPDAPAFAMVARSARVEGLLCGSSSGANVAAALQVAKKLGPGKRVVTIIPDGAERYMSKGIFSKWREQEEKPDSV